MRYLWLDLETTGLNPKAGQILEIGAVLTDGFFNEIERFHAIAIKDSNITLEPFVFQMHTDNGLLSAVEKSVYTEEDIINMFRSFLKRITVAEGFVTVGNSVNFDVNWLKERGLREWGSYTSHQVLDITSVKLFLKELGVSPPVDKPIGAVSHRVFGDLAWCQAQAEKYSTFVKKPSLLSNLVTKVSLSLRRLWREK